MRDVADALVGDGPRRGMDEDAVVAQSHPVLYDGVVAAGRAGQAPGGGVHVDLACTPPVVVDAVVGRVGVASGGSLHHAHHLTVTGDGDLVGGVVVGGDHGVAGPERVFRAARPHGDGGAGRPELVRPPAQLGVRGPVVLAADRGCGAHAHGGLGGRAVRDRTVEGDHDRLCHSDDLAAGGVHRRDRRVDRGSVRRGDGDRDHRGEPRDRGECQRCGFQADCARRARGSDGAGE